MNILIGIVIGLVIGWILFVLFVNAGLKAMGFDKIEDECKNR
jgi:NhaP-type Na+/H+ or K+/H+ antiporter